MPQGLEGDPRAVKAFLGKALRVCPVALRHWGRSTNGRLDPPLAINRGVMIGDARPSPSPIDPRLTCGHVAAG